MVSLYICDLPGHIDKQDIESLFSEYQGFIECRVVRDKNRDKIAFVDFEKEYQAKFAIEHLNGYRFPGSQKGMSIRISEHTRAGLKRRGILGLNNRIIESRPGKRDEDEDRHSERGRRSPERDFRYPPRQSPPRPPPEKKEMSLKDLIAATGMFGLFKMLGEGTEVPPPSVHPPIHSSVPIPEPSPPQFSVPPPMPPQPSYLVGHPKLPPERELPPVDEPRSFPKPSEPAPPAAGPFSTYVLNTLSHFYNVFQSLIKIPKNATNTVYVEGIPFDTSEREVAHIFRPFPGFRSVRLIPRDTKNGEKVLFCFADFETILQTTLVINTLQGYRFDKDDILGLQFSYATSNNKYKPK